MEKALVDQLDVHADAPYWLAEDLARRAHLSLADAYDVLSFRHALTPSDEPLLLGLLPASNTRAARAAL